MLGELTASRHWDGKDQVMSAVAQCAESFGSALPPALASQALAALVGTTARRNKKDWVSASLAAIKQGVKGLCTTQDVLTATWTGCLKEALEYLPPTETTPAEDKQPQGITGGKTSSEAKKEDEEEEPVGGGKRPLPLVDSLEVLAAVLQCASGPAVPAPAPTLLTDIVACLAVVLERNLPWATRVAALNALKSLATERKEASSMDMSRIVPGTVLALDDMKISQLREAGVSTLNALVTKTMLDRPSVETVKAKLESLSTRETNAALKDEETDLLRLIANRNA